MAHDQAEAQKLLRLMLETGLTATAIDFLWAAKQLGLQDWAFEELKTEFSDASAETAKGYLSHAQQQAKGLTVELSNITELLVGAGYDSTTVHGMLATLSQVMHGKQVPFAEKKS